MIPQCLRCGSQLDEMAIYCDGCRARNKGVYLVANWFARFQKHNEPIEEVDK